MVNKLIAFVSMTLGVSMGLTGDYCGLLVLIGGCALMSTSFKAGGF